SFISAGVVALSGGLTAVSLANNSPIGGLIERITIGGFLQWLFVIALMLYSTEAPHSTPSSDSFQEDHAE
ncbi:MAG: hypothetical protein LUQ13_02845, partial [Methanomicrobiales archaeon]|nr:hypothetical protein [Methanomicrobiales archaeon]